MLKVLNEQTLSTEADIEKRFPNCMYVYTVDGMEHIDDDKGYLYCVSTTPESTQQMCILEDDFILHNSRIPILSGSYNNGGTPGVQAFY